MEEKNERLEEQEEESKSGGEKKAVRVAGFPSDFTEPILRELVLKYPGVAGVKMEEKGSAVITFESNKEAKLGMTGTNNNLTI